MCSMSGGSGSSPVNTSSWRHSWHCTFPSLVQHTRQHGQIQTGSTLSLCEEATPHQELDGGWGRRSNHSPVPALRPPTPEVARTAPPTPVRDLIRTNGLVVGTKYSSTPLLEQPDSPEPHWNNNHHHREWNEEDKDSEKNLRLGEEKDLSLSHRNISGQSAETVLQKFRKSFSLRFHKKQQGGSSKETEDEEIESIPRESPTHASLGSVTREDDKDRFRFGPLVWRSSKERKKGKKAARNAKCNSGDSGIQIEMVGRAGGDSSESHDTDHLADEDTLDDLDSPPVVRRRGTGSSSESRPSRPTSDVINQNLIDKWKAEVQFRGVRRGGPVRRTHSDLGGQRLYAWEGRRFHQRRLLSPPARSRQRQPNISHLRHLKKVRGRPYHLRRSISQPIGINELSPLMRRKPPVVRNNVFSEDERGGATSDDEMMSDSESSVASLTDRKKSDLAFDDEFIVLAEAVWDHVAIETEELGFRAGDVIEVLDTLDREWWWGAKGSHTGWFPSSFVRLRVNQEDTVEDCLAGRTKSLRRRVSVSLLSNDQVRSKVVTELINTERDFVKLLSSVQQGYLEECQKRKDMFTNEEVKAIFSNLEEILDFQRGFLNDLEKTIDWEGPNKSCVADTFLKHRCSFSMYSEYCNAHPLAIATLQQMYHHNRYRKFFEACRLMQGLSEIPLDGYLLTPVQRICKYPLQLAELLKYTKTDHDDYNKLKAALEAMRGVAVLINERKRRMESLEKLAAWQHRVEGWEGEDLIETSTQLIHQGEAVRITTGMWTTNITLFLFDHQLIYCKKDILKRHTYVYKGRIQTDTSEIINLNDGKDPVLGVTVRHGIKIHSLLGDKWLVFCLRSADEKSAWLEAFKREREVIGENNSEGSDPLPPAAKQLATLAATHHRRFDKGYKRSNTDGGMVPASRNRLNGSSNHTSIGRKVGTWFMFGGNKKSRQHALVHPS